MNIERRDQSNAAASCHCDKYGHVGAEDLKAGAMRAENCQKAPCADRFGHLCEPGKLENNSRYVFVNQGMAELGSTRVT
jgi:hypothetical protein